MSEVTLGRMERIASSTVSIRWTTDPPHPPHPRSWSGINKQVICESPVLTSALLRRSFLKWVSVLHKSTASASACFPGELEGKDEGAAARSSLFKSTINHGEGEEYDRPVIHHAARTPFQMLIGLSVWPIVTAVSRLRGVATPRRGERRRAASVSGDARADLWRQPGAGPLRLFAEAAVQMTRKRVIYDGG